MQLCLIAPTQMLPILGKMSKTHLVLSHIYEKDKKYQNYYKERVAAGDWVMLDNSAYELGSSVSVNLLKEIAEDLKPSAIFLPDVRFDREETLKRVREAIPVLKDTGAKLIAVPQGDCKDDILACYDELCTIDGVGGFGLYEEIGEVCTFDCRADFLRLLEDTGRVKEGYYYHCLGMEEDVSQIIELAKFKWANSIDSVKPIVYGLNDMFICDFLYGKKLEYPHRPADYFSREISSKNCSPILANCESAIHWVTGKSPLL